MIEMKAYGRYDLQVKLWDGGMNEIDSFPIRQDLWVGPDTFVVRLTRDRDGTPVRYEDRGAVDGHGHIAGPSGYGGTIDGQLMKNGSVFLHATGGEADFVMLATQTGPDRYRCFRRLDVKEPTRVFGTDVGAGVYYVTTEDQLVASADEPPADVREPLAA